MAKGKKPTLTQATFGSRIAEDEADDLQSYFVETEQWRQLIAGDVDIVYGPKGSGKSALYSLLVSKKEDLRLGRRTVFVAAENPRGTPAFRDLALDPPATEEQFRDLWKLYFLTLLANYVRHHFATTKTSNPDAQRVIGILTQNGLLNPDLNLISRLKASLNYLRNILPAIETSITDPNTGLVVSNKITLSEPTTQQRDRGFVSVDELIKGINSALEETNIFVWLVLDRLDVAFSDTVELERNALRSLFRVYLDLRGHDNIDVKVFLRDDIWRKISEGGFREASHITRSLNISWDQPALLNLVVRRLMHNQEICEYYGIDKTAILSNIGLQSEFFYKVFPRQVAIGQKQPSTLDWMLSRTADGSRRNAPRELVHLLSVIRDEQLRLYELGNMEPPGENLIDRLAIRQALLPVSKVRYEQTLCAENPALKQYLDRLEGEKTLQNPTSLARLWRCSTEKASEIGDQLIETGFFEKKGSKDNPAYSVPFLYRGALRLVQGTA